MLQIIKTIFEPLQDFLETFYHAKKRSSEGGETITANEAEEILEKGRALYQAIEGAVKAARQ